MQPVPKFLFHHQQSVLAGVDIQEKFWENCLYIQADRMFLYNFFPSLECSLLRLSKGACMHVPNRQLRISPKRSSHFARANKAPSFAD